MVSWSRFGFVLRVLGHSFVFDVSHIARVGVGHIVSDNLSTAIREGNTVRAMGGIPVPVLILPKVCSRVVISYSILVSVNSWCVCWCSVGGRRGNGIGTG